MSHGWLTVLTTSKLAMWDEQTRASLLCPSETGFQQTPQILVNKCGSNGMMMVPYPNTQQQHMKIVNHLLYMYGVDVGTIPCGCGASTRASFAVPQWIRISALTSQILFNKCGSNGMMTDPYPSPHHMKIVNHLVYVWSGCGNHYFMWVWSLNMCQHASSIQLETRNDLTFQPQLPWSLWQSVRVTAWCQIHILIHCIWRSSSTLHMYRKDLGTIQCGFGTSTKAE